MQEFWLTHRVGILGACFLGAFLALGVAEIFRPRRPLQCSVPRRWACNLLISGANDAVALLLFRVGAVAMAANVALWPNPLRLAAAPAYLGVPLTLVLMDLMRYGLHRLNHSVPVLWRIHQLHHTDAECDLTTGLRFHPFEAILTYGADLLSVVVFGLPVLGVLALEVATALQDLFEHANIRWPIAVDAAIRRVIITSDMHRIHHSADVLEQNRNFGVIFPWWDRLFGTYIPEPALGQEGMRVGLDGAGAAKTNLWAALALPFRP